MSEYGQFVFDFGRYINRDYKDYKRQKANWKQYFRTLMEN